jgi:hypothetical protein
MNPCPKQPRAKVERKVQKLLSKHITTLPADLKHKLTPYHSKPLHLYGLPKIHKPHIPLRLTESSIGFPRCKTGTLSKELGPLRTVVAVCKPSISRYYTQL